jgi:hypothetical protein
LGGQLPWLHGGETEHGCGCGVGAEGRGGRWWKVETGGFRKNCGVYGGIGGPGDVVEVCAPWQTPQCVVSWSYSRGL